MEEYSAPATLVTPGGTVTFNDATGDTLRHDPTQCDGLGLMTDLRTSVDPASQTDGGLVHPSFGDARHVTLSGEVLVRTGGDDAAYVGARNTLMGALETALWSIRRADGTYSWTPTGGSLLTITVRCDIRVKFPGANVKNYVFGLVAADPAIA